MPEKATNAPLLTVNPIKAQVDEVIHIYLSRCPPKTEVTLRAKTTDEEGKLFESHAVFLTSEEGSLEVSSQKPIRVLTMKQIRWDYSGPWSLVTEKRRMHL